MGILNKLFKGLTLPKPDQDVLWIYIQCSNCGEKIKVRINPRTDLVPESGDTPGSVYTLHKEAIDNKCYRLIKIYLEFNANRSIIKQNIQGGQFVDEDSIKK
jgi:hypothetical protein